jgi:hypothetical protein
LLSRRRRFGPSLALPPIVSKALLLLLMFELSRWPRTPLSRPSERQKVGSAYLSRCSDFAPENFSGYFLAASMATPATRDREHLRSHHGWRLPKLPGVPERELRSCGRAASAASSRRFRQCLHRSSPTTRCWNASRTFRCALTRGNGALPNAFQEAVAMS